MLLTVHVKHLTFIFVELIAQNRYKRFLTLCHYIAEIMFYCLELLQGPIATNFWHFNVTKLHLNHSKLTFQSNCLALRHTCNIPFPLLIVWSQPKRTGQNGPRIFYFPVQFNCLGASVHACSVMWPVDFKFYVSIVKFCVSASSK